MIQNLTLPVAVTVVGFFTALSEVQNTRKRTAVKEEMMRFQLRGMVLANLSCFESEWPRVVFFLTIVLVFEILSVYLGLR